MQKNFLNFHLHFIKDEIFKFVLFGTQLYINKNWVLLGF